MAFCCDGCAVGADYLLLTAALAACVDGVHIIQFCGSAGPHPPCPMGIPALRTERLVLREPALADAPAVLVFRGDPRVQRFNDEPLRDVAAAEAFIRFLHADSASDALSAPATNASSRIFPSK